MRRHYSFSQAIDYAAPGMNWKKEPLRPNLAIQTTRWFSFLVITPR